MSRRSQILALGALLAVSAWSADAFAYSRSSGLSYTVSTSELSGYSRTEKEWFDPDYYSTCVWYVSDDWGFYCYMYNYQINYARADSQLDSPAGYYQTTQDIDLYDAVAPHSITLSGESGKWFITGRHYAEVDHYTQVCPYNFCYPPIYNGTYTFSAGYDTSAEWAVIPTTVTRYSTGVSLSDTNVDSILANGSSVLQADDSGGDSACRLTFQRSGSVSTFSVGNGLINSASDFNTVVAQPGRVQVVNQIIWCGVVAPPGTTWIGCADTQGMIVVRTTSSAEGPLWAHEYGHNQTLSHNANYGFVMYEAVSADNLRVVPFECNQMMDAVY